MRPWGYACNLYACRERGALSVVAGYVVLKRIKKSMGGIAIGPEASCDRLLVAYKRLDSGQE